MTRKGGKKKGLGWSKSKRDLAEQEHQRNKIRSINEALETDPVDARSLRQFALSSDGFVNNEIRRKVWPKLINAKIWKYYDETSNGEADVVNLFKSHKDWMQVVLDVDRCGSRLPAGIRASKRRNIQRQLLNVIMCVISSNNNLHYYQGFHDICLTLILSVGETAALALANKLARNHLRDFMESDMMYTKNILELMNPIIMMESPQLYQALQESNVGNVFAISWLITWFAHDFDNPAISYRLFDFFLAHHPLMPVYTAAAMVLRRSQEILECERDIGFLHSLLRKLPQDIPVEDLIEESMTLCQKYSPMQLTNWVKDVNYRGYRVIECYDALIYEVSRQRPDSIIQQLIDEGKDPTDSLDDIDSKDESGGGVFGNVSLWAVSATVGAAAVAIINTVYGSWI